MITDRYEIKNLLGEDVLGSLYKADDVMLQRSVMLRHIEHNDESEAEGDSDAWRKEFAQYVGKIGAIQHPNMPTVYDMSVKKDGVYIVTQLLKGESLAECLTRGPIEQMSVYRMASDILEIIHAAHGANIFHGALHTGSIRRVKRGSGGHRYLLVDLGLNQIVSSVRGEKIEITDPVLMAPELNEEGRESDAKADLFMLGQLCYTALVGGHPYSGKSAEECLEEYKNYGLPPIEDYVEGLDPYLSAWVKQMTEIDPEKRFNDSGEAIIALHTISNLAQASLWNEEPTATF